jgi:hypothetical protein
MNSVSPCQRHGCRPQIRTHSEWPARIIQGLGLLVSKTVERNRPTVVPKHDFPEIMRVRSQHENWPKLRQGRSPSLADYTTTIRGIATQRT